MCDVTSLIDIDRLDRLIGFITTGQAIESCLPIGSSKRHPMMVSSNHNAGIIFKYRNESIGDAKLNVIWSYLPRSQSLSWPIQHHLRVTNGTHDKVHSNNNSNTTTATAAVTRGDGVTKIDAIGRLAKVGFTYYYGALRHGI
jgi:hypothetical protein